MHRSTPSFSFLQAGLLALAMLVSSSCFIIAPVTVDEDKDEDDMSFVEDMARSPDLSQAIDMSAPPAEMGNESDLARAQDMPAMPPEGWDLPSHRRRLALEAIDTIVLPNEDLIVLV